MNIEPLESRIAPAAIFKFTDVDGDAVTITTSKGTASDLAAIITVTDEGIGQKLQRIDFSLSPFIFAGTNLTVTAKRTAEGGDGLANAGFIDASAESGGTALDLGFITIRGDLGRIRAGDEITGTAAVKGLKVQSMGEFGISTQEAGGSLFSVLNGALSSLRVAGNVREVRFVISSGVDGKIGSVTIGGSLIGTTALSGSIQSDGAMGPVKIGGNIEGGLDISGFIRSGSTLAEISVAGSLIGGAGSSSGQIISIGSMGPVKIGGNIVGGGGIQSGVVDCGGTLAAITIGGDIEGGSASSSGAVIGKRIGSLTVGGSIIAGSGTVTDSGAVRAVDDIGVIRVKGSLIGNPTTPVMITARGQAEQGATTDVAIKSLTVKGRVEFTDVLAGYDGNRTGVNADAQIGAVVVGDWIASNLVAGVQDDASALHDAFFADGDDQAITGGSSSIVSKIGSITIKGTALGTLGGGVDSFGFVAQQIGSFKIGRTPFPLSPGAANDLAGLFASVTGDLLVREVAP
jgi:hypothetical protein